MIKGVALLIISALALSLYVPFAYAQTKIGFNTYLQPSQPNIDDTITIKIELVNPTNFLIKIPRPSLKYELTYNGLGELLGGFGKENKISEIIELSSGDIVIEARGKYQFTIPLDEYNSRDEDDRIGEWTFNSQITSWGANSKIDFFDEKDNKWKSSIFELQTVSNPIKFSIEKEPVKPPPRNPLDFLAVIINWFKENIIVGAVIIIIGTVIAGLILKQLGIK